ncbi:MAG: MFS transporter [Mongoliitalea sp.]
MKSRKNLLIFISFIAFISLGLPDGLLGIAWPFISEAIDIRLEKLGLILMAFVAGYLSASLSNSKISTFISLGWLLAGSCMLTGVSLWAFTWAGGLTFLLIAAYFLGAGGGAIDTSLNIFASANFSPSVVNWLHAFYGIGATSGPLILTYLFTQGDSWTIGYFIVGGIQIGLGLVFLSTIKLWKSQSSSSKDTKAGSFSESIQQPMAYLSILVFFLYTGFEIGVGQWLYTILTQSRGIAEDIGGIWVSTYWGSLTLGRIFFGFVLRKSSTSKVLSLGTIGIVLGSMMLYWDVNANLSYFSVALIGLSCAPIFPSMIALASTLFQPKFAPTLISFQISAAMVGGALLPASSGFLAEYFGLEIIAFSFAIQAILLALAYAVIYRFKKRNALAD